MDLRLGVTDALLSDKKNYKGEPLFAHTFIIYDKEIRINGQIVDIYRWESTFTQQWKERDMTENVKKAKSIMGAIIADPTMIERGEISYRIEPSAVIVGDQYENDCKVLELP